MTMPATNTTPTTSISAGSNLLARRIQNCRKFSDPCRSHSANSKEVIRNPESTKKMSTDRKPPGIVAAPPW